MFSLSILPRHSSVPAHSLEDKSLAMPSHVASEKGQVTPPRWSRARRIVRWVLWRYLRFWHQFQVLGYENIPRQGPALALTNHASLLDVPALMAADIYPESRLVAKASLFKFPILRQVLHAWGAIPVERQGRDTSSVRAILQALRAGHVVAIAAEGQRTRSGRLQPINPVLARIAVSAGVPIIPIGIGGSFAALPPGRPLPRRKPIVMRLGRPFLLERGTEVEVAAARIQAEIAALLPADQQPVTAQSSRSDGDHSPSTP